LLISFSGIKTSFLIAGLKSFTNQNFTHFFLGFSNSHINILSALFIIFVITASNFHLNNLIFASTKS